MKRLRDDALAGLVDQAQQELVVAYAAALAVPAERGDRLHEQLEAVLGQRLLEHRQPVHLLLVARHRLVVLRVDDEGVAATVLGRVAGDIGRLHDRGEIAVALADLDQPEAAAHREGVTLVLEHGVLEVIEQLVGHRLGLVRRDIDDDHAELVTAEPGEHVARAQPCRQRLGQLAQQPVTGRVPAGVVDDLELIEVDVAERVTSLAVRQVVDELPQTLLEVEAVVAAGQGVAVRPALELHCHLALLADVLQHEDEARAGDGARGHARERQREGRARAARAGHQHVDLELAALLVDGGGQRVELERRAALGAGEAQGALERRLDDPCRIEPEPQTGAAVDVQAVPVRVDRDDRVADRGERALGLLALGLDGGDAERPLAPHQALLVDDAGGGRAEQRREQRAEQRDAELVGARAQRHPQPHRHPAVADTPGAHRVRVTEPEIDPVERALDIACEQLRRRGPRRLERQH